MLTTAGIALVAALQSGRDAALDELVADTGYSRAHLYEVVDELVASGLLAEQRGPKNQRRVRVTDHPVVEAYRDLNSTLSHVAWHDLLSPALLRVCWYLDEPRRIADIAARLDVTPQAVHEVLSPLKNRAMLAPSGPEYALTDDLSPLVAFAREVVLHTHRSRVREQAPSATVDWCDPRRAVVRVHTPEDTTALQSATDWRLSGLARFREYGLEFYLAGEPAFWYSPEEGLTPAQLVCQTLALDSGPRRLSYAMLLIEHLDIDAETLRDLAPWYGVATPVEAMLQALTTGFDRADGVYSDLPSESEYMALTEQYEVS